MRRSPSIVIDVSPRGLFALHARTLNGAVTIRHAVSEPVPEEVNAADPAALGAWMAKALASAGFPRHRAIYLLRREQVTLRALELPTADPAELPDMVRLALRRDLPIDTETAAIDYRIERRERSTRVLAAAAPPAAVEFVRAVAHASGLAVLRIGVRCLGTAALVNLMDLPAGPRLGVDLTGDGLELALVDGAEVHLTHGAAPRPSDATERAEALVREIRRAWIAHMGSGGPPGVGVGAPTAPLTDSNAGSTTTPPPMKEGGPTGAGGSPTVRRTIVLGPAPLAGEVAPALAGLVGAPVEILGRHPAVRGTTDSLGPLWPLAGALLESAEVRIDLAHPREAPDLAARKRQRMLAAAAIIVLAAMVAYTVGAGQRRREVERHDSLVTKARATLPEALRHRRDELKLRHLDTWGSASTDWLDRFTSLVKLLPEEPGDVVLDVLSGRQEASGVDWSSRDGWRVDTEQRILVEGEARTRRLADDLRQRLVGRTSGTVTTTGSDTRGGTRLPFRFGYTVRSVKRITPPAPEKAAAKAPDDTRAAQPADNVSAARPAGAVAGADAAPVADTGGAETGDNSSATQPVNVSVDDSTGEPATDGGDH